MFFSKLDTNSGFHQIRFDEESSFFQHLFSAGIFPEEDGQHSSWIRGSTLSHGPYSDRWKRQARERYQTEASARHTVSERLDNQSWEVLFLQETAGLLGPSRGDGSACNIDMNHRACQTILGIVSQDDPFAHHRNHAYGSHVVQKNTQKRRRRKKFGFRAFSNSAPKL